MIFVVFIVFGCFVCVVWGWCFFIFRVVVFGCLLGCLFVACVCSLVGVCCFGIVSLRSFLALVLLFFLGVSLVFFGFFGMCVCFL